MRVAAFVQARMGSRRLAGKSMLPIWRDMPLIELVLRRVRSARSLDRVVLVTTSHDRDDPLAAVARRLGVVLFRGSEQDVLGRFAAALGRYPADAVVRVCADNPFIEPRAIEELVRFFQSAQPCDYASNHTARSGLPDGIGSEIIAAGALRRAAIEAATAYDREHVPAFVVARPDDFRIAFAPPPERPWPFFKLDVDTAEDYRAMRALAQRLPDRDAPLWDRAAVMAALSPAAHSRA
jgi:spore coat polysaccharide biosynthesis protein SpsF